jgi:hypothetical protein
MVEKKEKVEKAAEGLWKDPSEKNWRAFSTALKGSSIRYYRVVFQNGGKLNKIQDLAKSFAELYDAKYRLVAKVPIFKKEGKSIRGATIYLIGLQVSNKK